MSGSRSRRKGAQAERDLAKRYAEAMPGAECKRGIGQARRGSEVADVEVPHFWPESKKQRRANVRAALAQAIEAAEAHGEGRVPVAHIHDDRKEPFVVLREEDFLRFVGEWWGARQFDPIGKSVWTTSPIMDDAEAKCAAADRQVYVGPFLAGTLGDRDDS